MKKDSQGFDEQEEEEKKERKLMLLHFPKDWLFRRSK
jgi:hypothetical protein